MAKSPTDRPWDAAAVAAKLTELRDKAERGAPVAMVWPSSGPAAAKPSRAGARRGRQRRRRLHRTHAEEKAQSRLDTKRPLSGRTSTGRLIDASWLNRSTIETGLLALALVAIGGFIAYLVWPPSAEYLYQARRSSHGLEPDVPTG